MTIKNSNLNLNSASIPWTFWTGLIIGEVVEQTDRWIEAVFSVKYGRKSFPLRNTAICV